MSMSQKQFFSYKYALKKFLSWIKKLIDILPKFTYNPYQETKFTTVWFIA